MAGQIFRWRRQHSRDFIGHWMEVWHRWDKMAALLLLLLTIAKLAFLETEVTAEEQTLALKIVIWEMAVIGGTLILGYQYVKVFRPGCFHYCPDLFTTVFKCDATKLRHVSATKQAFVQTDDRNMRLVMERLQNKHFSEMRTLRRQLSRMKKLFIEQYKISYDILQSKQNTAIQEERELGLLRGMKSAMLDQRQEIERQIELEKQRNEELMYRLERLYDCLERAKKKNSHLKPPDLTTLSNTSLHDLASSISIGSMTLPGSRDLSGGDTAGVIGSRDAPLHRLNAQTHLAPGNQPDYDGAFVYGVTLSNSTGESVDDVYHSFTL